VIQQGQAAGIEPLRDLYDLRHTYATFALRAGVSVFAVSHFIGSSIAMIDPHYGHLARDSREHAVSLLDALAPSTLWYKSVEASHGLKQASDDHRTRDLRRTVIRPLAYSDERDARCQDCEHRNRDSADVAWAVCAEEEDRDPLGRSRPH
jgi:hypothetical protein